MKERTRTLQKARAWANTKLNIPLIRYALTGDGSNAVTSDVDGRPGWAWVRYDEKQDKASQVLNTRFPGIGQDVPVIVGKMYAIDKYYQILGINMELYIQQWGLDAYLQYLLPKHGDTHTAGTGSDPAWMNIRNLLPGRVRSTVPAGLSVYAEALVYETGGILYTWAGGAIDLTAYLPPDADTHRYALISINPVTNGLAVTEGEITPTGIPPSIPAVPATHLPLAVVELISAMTEIEEDNIYDYRILFGGVGPYLTHVNKLLAAIENQFDMYVSTHIMEG